MRAPIAATQPRNPYTRTITTATTTMDSMPSSAVKRRRVDDVGSGGGGGGSSSNNIGSTITHSLCRKCIISSLLLTSFQQRYVQTVTLDLSVDCCDNMAAFLRQIPAQMRQGVVDGYTNVTMGRPVHHHNSACPLSSHLTKRKEFLQICPFPLGTHHYKHLTDTIVKAYKCYQVCDLCGTPRMPARTPTTTTTTTTTTTHKCFPLTTITSSSIFTTKDAYITLQLNLATANSTITKDELAKQQKSTTSSNRHNPSPRTSSTPISTSSLFSTVHLLDETTSTTPYPGVETTLPGEIYNKHSCFACQHLTNPRQRSFQHYQLLKGHCPNKRHIFDIRFPIIN